MFIYAVLSGISRVTLSSSVCVTWEQDEGQPLSPQSSCCCVSSISRGETFSWEWIDEWDRFCCNNFCISSSCLLRYWTSHSMPSIRLVWLEHHIVFPRINRSCDNSYSDTGSFGISKKTHCFSNLWHLVYDQVSMEFAKEYRFCWLTFHMVSSHHIGPSTLIQCQWSKSRSRMSETS